MVPWSKSDSRRFTHSANTPKRQRAWSEIADKNLRKGYSEASAIRIANAAVKHVGKGRKKS